MRTPLMALDACLLMTIGASTAGADPISLAPPPSTYVDQFYQGQWEGGPGISRELVFEDVAAFQLNSFGMEFNPSETTTTVTARLYEFTGTSTVGALLASSSVTVSDFGRGFYDVPLSYLLPGTGTRYMLSMGWNVFPHEATFFDFEGFGDFSLPQDPSYTAGPFRVLDGKAGGGTDNFVLNNFRADVSEPIPEPTSLSLLALGLAGFGVTRWRQRKT